MTFIGHTSGDKTDIAAVERVLRDLRRQAVTNAVERDLFRSRAAERFVKEAEARSRIFDPRGHLFGDPAWNILVAIYSLTAQHRSVTVSDAANASLAPPSTGLRYINSLISAGLLVREPDWQDRRKSFVQLSERGETMVQDYLDRTMDF